MPSSAQPGGAELSAADLPLEAIATTASGGFESREEMEARRRNLLKPRQPPTTQTPLALSFSGGGWRAALAAAGVLRFVADAGLLGKVRWVSSVSGGSVTNGLFASAYERLSSQGFNPGEVDRLVLAKLLDAARDQSLQNELLANAWRALGLKTRTDVLADAFDRWLFEECKLEDLPPDCRFIFNAANAATGVRFEFSADRVGDYLIGYLPTNKTSIRLSQAVAISAAVPGAFSATRLRGLRFPEADGKETRLVDGGVYDNLGLEAIDDLGEACLIVLSAGGLFRTGLGLMHSVPFVGPLKRSQELLYRQATALRSRTMVERFQEWEDAGTPKPEFGRRGVLFGLATTIDEVPDRWLEGRPEHAENRFALAKTKTTFARIPAERAEQLIYRGWWLAGASLTKYQPALLNELPVWRPLPAGVTD